MTIPFGLASLPLSRLGAGTAVRIHPERLEAAFGALLLVAVALLVWR